MPPKRLSFLALLALIPPLFAASPETAKHIDREWFRQTLAGETAHWREAALRPNGFFAVNLDRQWRPVGARTEHWSRRAARSSS